MLWIPDQLVAAQQGQDVTLKCHIEAYPKSISYWTTAKGDMIISGEVLMITFLLCSILHLQPTRIIEM